MRMLRGIPSWGRCPQTPGIFRFAARMGRSWGAGCARPQPIPAAESALGLRSRSALSSAQVSPEWTTATLPCNDLSSDGDYPLNFVSQSRGSLQISMKERVAGAGGTLTIKSRPAEGTRVEARIPLPGEST